MMILTINNFSVGSIDVEPYPRLAFISSWWSSRPTVFKLGLLTLSPTQ